ncbi:ankyrin repeat protein, putative [Trichomonas vaginalis G3]|uniref:Ankyrin repeat protein, putative n=1 Tax=Trichomonas vaginalis (strain ATCC PRA-98 / G3) TaxID=412133 RepID=A2E730_TRIV3|nr:ankyrin repeat and SOCS box-containing protein 4 family [Trichomonas vaginalis G3]EAY11548.1 ankyrin repeat protein, putative [Trichomonas vaginalis G3]KAI5489432.1 ankyrin repeat and SOCS box-containing protein 4 family [Trichomonas vaginalis G3]|eukprot:XP_001323771.1 ankyrin repeat protein [Trichomonas vaginalis G3]
MSDQDVYQNKYSELRNIFKYYIDSDNALYQLKTEKEEEITSIYKMIKTELIDSKKYTPKKVINDILSIIPYNNRYTKSYLEIAKHLSDEYHVTEVDKERLTSNSVFYGVYFQSSCFNFSDYQSENTIYGSIMRNDKEKFICFTEREGFDKSQKITSSLFPLHKEYSLLELCCFYGAVDCFKLLRTKFNSEITKTCLNFSFLGGNQEIMSECLKHQEPDNECMSYAIISHNIDFVTYLMNEYNIKIDLYDCGKYNNLESLLVYFDQTNDVKTCFIFSIKYNILPLFEYFISHGVDIYGNMNDKDEDKIVAIHYAAKYSKEIVELLISRGADINIKDKDEKTALHHAVEYGNQETAELLISHGANINEKDKDGNSALYYAAEINSEKIAELLISHGANINEKYYYEKTALHVAAENNNKKIVEPLISHGANVNEKDKYGRTALHFAAEYDYHKTIKILISHDANINEKDKDGNTALYYAVKNNNKETIKLLISHGAIINEKE